MRFQGAFDNACSSLLVNAPEMLMGMILRPVGENFSNSRDVGTRERPLRRQQNKHRALLQSLLKCGSQGQAGGRLLLIKEARKIQTAQLFLEIHRVGFGVTVGVGDKDVVPEPGPE